MYAARPRLSLARRLALSAVAVAAFAWVNLFDPSHLHSMWHSDSMFGNYYIGRGKRALALNDTEQAKQAAERVLWMAMPEYRTNGYLLLAEALRREGRAAAMNDALREAARIERERADLPVLDDFGNKHFPPST